MSIAACIRQRKPLVHCLSNYVSMDYMARGLLAAGARPVMVLDKSESGIMAAHAGALTLNTGTWGPDRQAAMLVAGEAAVKAGIPIVLDPVGAGALPVRTQAALEILERVKVTAIRGNGGEILGLAGHMGRTRGVDSAIDPGRDTQVLAAARELARRFGCLVVATGKTDLVTDGRRTLSIRAGHPLMGEIPGSGCLGAALLAAGLAAAGPSLETAAEAMLWIAYAGELAAGQAKGPGSFVEAYLDVLYSLDSLPAGRVTPHLADRLSVYPIVSGTTPLSVIEQTLAAGAGVIQFREKKLPMPQQVEAAAAVRDLCRQYGAIFLINDRVDLALAVGADGVHLGQEDLPVADARRLLGSDAVIGATCETPAEALTALVQGADYIGTGPVYATPSKADAGEPQGPAIVERVTAATPLPVVGIGGIGIGGAAPVIAAGACGVSVISAILSAPDPAAATRILLEEVRAAKGERLA
jgi:thiamine-phosphate pyrophosphorylase